MRDKLTTLWNNLWFWFGFTVLNFMHTAYFMMAKPSWFIFLFGTIGTVASYIVTLRMHAPPQKTVATNI